MGLGKWLLKHSAPGFMTKNILKNYLYIKEQNPLISDEFYIRQMLLLHFKNIAPENLNDLSREIFDRLPFKSAGINYDDKPIAFFDYLCKLIDGNLFAFVVSYILLYNRNKIKYVISIRYDFLEVIESLYMKIIPNDHYPLREYSEQIDLIFNYVIYEIS